MKQTLLQVTLLTTSGTIVSVIDKVDGEYTLEQFSQWLEKTRQNEEIRLNVEELGILSVNLIKFGYV